jgi:DNA mismatch repair ATPase MutS
MSILLSLKRYLLHYHELNEMSEVLPRIQNYNVAVKELKDTVLFVRKLVKEEALIVLEFT